jgi:formylglycine-generating enzyme required for sulfatase activity
MNGSLEDTLGLVGTTIDDKYVVDAVVGEGGFAIVYRATHKLWQKPVAIKCFKNLGDARPDVRERLLKDFIQEGALLSELSARSASIVQARDVGTLTTASGAWVPFMVLEWLEGQTLEDLWSHDRGPWPVARAMQVLEPVAEALELAHRRNIAHRDVKPANVFVLGEPFTEHMAVKLLDFGIAKVVQSAADQGFTKTGNAVTSFTPSYGAPEQFSRAQGATGPWTDVYALALMFGELVSGRFALEGDDFIQLGMQSADPSRRPTPRTLGVELGDALEAVLAKALAVKPTERFPSAGAFWNALREAEGAGPMRRLGTTTGPNSRRGEAFAQTAVFDGGAPPPSIATRGPTTSPVVEASAIAAPAKRTSPLVWAAPLALIVLGGGAFFAMRGARGGDGGAGGAGGKAAASKVADGPKASAPTSASQAAPKPACPEGMAAIPGGKFFMGSDDPKADEDEKPQHQVVLSPYCIDVKEVTVARYKACSDAGECKRGATDVDWPEATADEKKAFGPACTLRDPVGLAQHPINCVDWDMARQFCEAHGDRLPTEAEWEFAARGPDGRVYPWGDEAPDETRLNACGSECVAWGKKAGQPLQSMFKGDDGHPLTAPVGSFPKGASRYGLLDVVGNVWEWTSDWEGEYPKDGKPQSDPKGPASGTERVIRGGAWNGAFAAWVRPTQRYQFAPTAKTHAIGFRCARSQPTTPAASDASSAKP